MSEDIFTAINKIMRDVSYVQKTGKMTGGISYKYAGEADLIGALRPAMVDNGVIMTVKEVTGIQRSDYTTKNGSLMNVVLFSGVVEFTHAPSKTSITVMSIGEGSDTGDKASYKAMTGMYKYAMRQTFCIETGDDPDSTPSTEQERGKPASRPMNRPANISCPTNVSKPAAVQAAEELGGVVVETDLRIEPEKLKTFISKKANGSHKGQPCSKEQRGLLVGMLNEIFQNSNAANQESDRKEFCNWLVGFASSKDIPDNYVLSMLDWIAAEKDSGGAYLPNVDAVKEAHAALVEARKEAGQMTIL